MIFTRCKNKTLLRIAEEQITNRRLSTPAGWRTEKAEIKEKRKNAFLVHGQYWFKYSRRFGSRVVGSGYLVGEDEGQLFAVRVPVTVDTIDAAYEFLTPAIVKKARENGKLTFRQGDIFYVEMRLPDDDMKAIALTRHEYKTYTNTGLKHWYRWITHPEHTPVELPRGKFFRAVQSTQVHGIGGD